jgi:hypothetical protein
VTGKHHQRDVACAVCGAVACGLGSPLSADKVMGISYITHTYMDIGRTLRIFTPSMING